MLKKLCLQSNQNIEQTNTTVNVKTRLQIFHLNNEQSHSLDWWKQIIQIDFNADLFSADLKAKSKFPLVI